MTFNVAFILFPDFEELDFVGPYEVFGDDREVHRHRMAGLQRRRDAGGAGVPRAAVLADHTFADAPTARHDLCSGRVRHAPVMDACAAARLHQRSRRAARSS